jgi:fatty acid desaturase
VTGPAPYDPHSPDARFRPLRPASQRRLIVAFVVGPLVWVVALIVVAWVVVRRDAVEAALAVTAASLVVAAPILGVLYALRRREERRYADAR